MGYNGYGYSNIQRPPATTWAQQQQYNAEDAFNGAGAGVAGDVTAAGTARTSASAGADTALSGVLGYKPTQTMGFSPTNVGGFDPSAYLAPGGVAAGGAYAGQTSGPAGYNAGNLAKFSADDVKNFDPSAFGNTFAQGAYGQFKNNLSDQLTDLTNKGAAAGRLNTGYFDIDQGKVVNRLGSDFSNAIAQEAGVFSGQKLSALTSAAGFRESAAAAADSDMLGAAESTNQFNLGAGGQALEARGQDIGRAEYGANLAYSRAGQLDTDALTRAQDIDKMTFDAKSTGLSAALEREGRAGSEYDAAANRQADYLSAGRDWASQDRAAADNRTHVAAEDATNAERLRQAQLALMPSSYTPTQPKYRPGFGYGY